MVIIYKMWKVKGEFYVVQHFTAYFDNNKTVINFQLHFTPWKFYDSVQEFPFMWQTLKAFILLFITLKVKQISDWLNSKICCTKLSLRWNRNSFAYLPRLKIKGIKDLLIFLSFLSCNLIIFFSLQEDDAWEIEFRQKSKGNS